MKKADLVKLLATEHNLTITLANRVLDSVVTVVQKTVAEGNRIAIPGLGAFSSVPRPARKMKTPNGTEVTIEARRVPRFSAALQLRDAAKSKPVPKRAAAKKAA